jgi:hypothetical protein
MMRFAKSVTTRDTTREEDKLHALYPSLRDERSLVSREKERSGEIQEARERFNYREMKKAKLTRAQRMTGMLKHLNGKDI